VSPFFLGLDAGNSKTVALVADASGRILGRGRGGVGDIYGVPHEEDAVAAVLTAVHTALDRAAVRIDDVGAAAFRLAGVDWDEDEAFWVEAVADELPGLRQVSIKNDGFAILRCGAISGTGVAVTAGSGPAVAARGWDGQEYCASWWIQHELAGQGLGNAAFRAVVDADAGSGPQTALTAELLALFDYTDVTAMLYAFTRRGSSRPNRDKWAAARSVLRAAGTGDPVAMGIVSDQAAAFAALARVAAERTGLGADGRAVPVVLGGSILTSEHPSYREALVEALGREIGAVEVASSAASPVAGAVLDALAEGGVTLDQPLHDRVLTASHPADFLLT
jgi:N-acetylglucosamine kinase-like BadF-type ATPase